MHLFVWSGHKNIASIRIHRHKNKLSSICKVVVLAEPQYKQVATCFDCKNIYLPPTLSAEYCVISLVTPCVCFRDKVWRPERFVWDSSWWKVCRGVGSAIGGLLLISHVSVPHWLRDPWLQDRKLCSVNSTAIWQLESHVVWPRHDRLAGTHNWNVRQFSGGFLATY